MQVCSNKIIYSNETVGYWQLKSLYAYRIVSYTENDDCGLTAHKNKYKLKKKKPY